MLRNLSVILAVIIANLGINDAGFAQSVSDFPDRSDPLHKRMEMFDALMRGNHWNENTVMPYVIFPPAGLEKPLIGNQEDCAGHTAVYLAAYSFQYASTGDPKARQWANQILDGLLRLEAVTGISGWVARSFNQTDTPLWHEKTNFFSTEWHASTSMPGYRWQGDLSSDKFVDICFGISTYYDYCADETQKKIAADFLDRFVGRVVDHNFRLVDVDNKMTLWGNFCPDLPHAELNSLEMLSGLKTAHHVTGDARYDKAYRMLIEKHGYDDRAIMAKVLHPKEWMTPWDDQLAAQSYYPLFRYETDADLLQKYRMSLNRHWHYWKDAGFEDEHMVFYHMLYETITDDKVVGPDAIDALKSMWGGERGTGQFSVPQADGSFESMESAYEGHTTYLALNYWFGRLYGFIQPEW